MIRSAAPPSLDAFFRALADPTRLRLLNLIADKEICVCYFVEILRLSQPKISRHLAYLRRAGIVGARREGRWMHYRLLNPADTANSEILKETLARLRQMPDMQSDLIKLETRCCNADSSEVLKQAPQPIAHPIWAE